MSTFHTFSSKDVYTESQGHQSMGDPHYCGYVILCLKSQKISSKNYCTNQN